MEVITKHRETGNEQAFFGINDVSVERDVVLLYPRQGAENQVAVENSEVVHVISENGPAVIDFVERFVEYVQLASTDVTVYTHMSYRTTAQALSKLKNDEPGVYDQIEIVKA